MMSDPSITSSLPLRSELPRKIALLFLLIIDTAIGIFFLFRLRPDVHQLIRLTFADLSLGVVAGFSARIILKKRNWFIRFISATAGLIVGLLTLGVLTRFQLGFGPIYFWRTTIDWSGLVQIGLGINCTLLAMLAWSKPGQARPASPGNGAVTTSAQPQAKGRAKQKRKRTRSASARNIATSQQTAIVERRSKPVISKKRLAKTEIKSTPAQYQRKPLVRLSTIEKHLCPYCLEPVVHNDPRGIVECEICHTQHHGDCWAIAGFCQVPHYTA